MATTLTGIIKQVKVYIASKRKLSVGDKWLWSSREQGCRGQNCSGRRSPFLHDGTPVEIVLNPLGVPSRMNVGHA